ncbi:MAG: T9SS type A sorting domain-containing protein [Bacteroidetes bacterium]|nr:T9SS type A sorting domain-containing protein [Bacteroidota bacterium]
MKTIQKITLAIAVIGLMNFLGMDKGLAQNAGDLDLSFGTNGFTITQIGSRYSVANAVTVQSDGKIILAGYSHISGYDNFSVARFYTEKEITDSCLIAHYPFSGNAADSSGNNHHGDTTDLPPTLTTDRFGNPNSAYRFDGNDDYITINEPLLVAPEEATISAWINYDQITIEDQIFYQSCPDDADVTIQFRLNSTGFQIMFGLNAAWQAPYTFFPGNWYHLVMAWENYNTVYLFVNGTPVASKTFTNPLSSNAPDYIYHSIIGRGKASAGCSYDYTQVFDGIIDDMRIYGCMLDVASVDSLYHEGGWPLDGPFSCGDSLLDVRDGQYYQTVLIGQQCWMAENLNTSQYQNGDPIPDGTGAGDYSGETNPQYFFNYDDNPANASVYGKLYTWFAIADDRHICPYGWHEPAESEWTVLFDFIGGTSYGGGKLKETGTVHWNSPNSGATDEYGFTALPGGDRNYYSGFLNLGDYAHFWTTDSLNPGYALQIELGYNFEDIVVFANDLGNGLSVRCIKNIASGMSLNITPVHIDCHGDSTGSASVDVSGGTSPYTYLWSTGEETQGLVSLPAGWYYVTVTDDNTNTAADSVEITQPPALTISLTGTDISCYGAADGNASVTVSGGTYPYSYLWNTGCTDEQPFVSTAGTYTITVTDNNGCTITDSIGIDEPAQLIVTLGNDTTIYPGDSLELIPDITGGTYPYSYLWNTGCTDEQPFVSTAGTYTLTVTDANGCISCDSITVTLAPSGMTITEQPVGGTVCEGDSFEASVTVSETPQGYLWYQNGTALTGETDSSLVINPVSITDEGEYYCLIWNETDSITTDTFTLTVSVQPTAAAGNDQAVCADGQGVYLNGSVTGASGCVWSTTGTGTFIPSATILDAVYMPSADDLATGNVILTLTTTGNGACSAATDDITVTFTPLPYTEAGDDATACGLSYVLNAIPDTGSTGQWQAQGGVTFGNASHPNSTVTVTSSGTYSFVWCENIGYCSACDTVIITFTEEITINVIENNETCSGSDGSANIIVSGGNTPYSYQWSTGATSVALSGLTAGIYSLTVTDAAGCTETATATIINPYPLLLSSSVTDETGTAGGSIDLTVAGGVLPYSYLWSNGDTTQDIGNLSAGIYTVTVTDYSGCTEEATVCVNYLCGLVLSITTTNSECGEETGTATVTATGGVTPYSYIWSNGDILATADSLASGTYMVTVTDDYGCSAVKMVNVADEGSATISLTSVHDAACNGEQNGAILISVTGSAPPFTFEWSSGASTEDVMNLPAGTYYVIVEDTMGCIATAGYTIAEPEEISVSATTTNSSCMNADGSAALDVSGGTTPYLYTWSTGATTAVASSLAAGVYTVTIQDANLCFATTSAQITISDDVAPGLVADSIWPAGCGLSNGAVYMTASGGITPYTYTWSDGSTTADLTGIQAATYNLTVTDASGCAASYSAVVPPTGPEIQPICMVTVDSAANRNLIVWEKVQSSGIDHYNIYREIFTDEYYKVAEVLYDDMSEYLDLDANPNTRSWRYSISAVDECGAESDLCDPHKTMHLTINVGLNQQVNLIWDKYEGFGYNRFYIYRHNNNTGWVTVDSLPDTYWTFTDTPPNWGQLYYRIGVPKDSDCVPTSTDKASGGPYHHAFSNLDDNGFQDDGIVEIAMPGVLVIYPNPFSECTTIIFENTENESYKMVVTGISGQVVRQNKNITGNQIQFQRGDLSPGFYTIELRGSNTYRGKVIVR